MSYIWQAMSYFPCNVIFGKWCHIWQALSYFPCDVIFQRRWTCVKFSLRSRNISASLNVCQIFTSLNISASLNVCQIFALLRPYLSVAERVSNYRTSDIKIIKSKKLQHGHFSGVGTGIFHISSQGENLQVKTIFSQWECRIMALDQLTVL